MSSDAEEPRDGVDAPERRPGTLAYWGPAIAVSFSMFIAVIDSTLINVAIPAIVSGLDTTVPVVQGAIAVYSLVIAALMLPGGKLPSIYGVRRLMQGTLVIYVPRSAGSSSTTERSSRADSTSDADSLAVDRSTSESASASGRSPNSSDRAQSTQ